MVDKKIKNALLILYYDKENLTTRCLNSAIKNGYASEEIFTFDNGSKIEVYNSIKSRFPQICHLRSENNFGYSGGFNRGVEAVFKKGFEGILFLTNDTIVYEDSLGACLDASLKYDAQLVAPCVRYLNDNETIDSIGGYFDLETLSLKHYYQIGLYPYLDKENDYIPGTAFYLKKEVFEKTGGMNEKYHTYWEDADFSYRARKLGFKSVRTYEAKIDHAVGKTCHKKSLYTTFYYQRNRIFFALEHFTKETRDRIRINMENELLSLKKKSIEKKDLTKLGYIEQIFEELKRL
ncbi:MAG TPA: glycosyltransferase family 2 protein [Spirochaetota bacterium]|nr:glycosyltransferase family 2 protein [Spirochaetota bacterium]